MTFTIEFSDEQGEILRTKPAAEGLSVEEWIYKLAEGASQHDHYIYGWPKRDV
jgi:hypothetical protein